MKQSVTAFFLLLYLSSASGMVINVHYCGTEMAKISVLNFSRTRGCDCNPDNDPMDCCNNNKFYNKADTHKKIHVLALPEIPVIPVPTYLIPADLTALPGNNNDAESVSNTTLCCPRPVYLLNNVFRI